MGQRVKVRRKKANNARGLKITKRKKKRTRKNGR